MATSSKFATQQFRIVSDGPHHGATCWLTGPQSLGFNLPDPVPAYAPGRATVPVQVPAADIKDFELV